MYLGAKPVFADITMDSYCIDPDDIERHISKKTKLIIPVHYAGQSAEMDAIRDIAVRHNLLILEDAAEAHLAEFGSTKVGSLGDAAIFSFTPSKPMTTGEGGMITTNDSALADKCLSIRNFHDAGKFEWTSLGFNFRMPEAMGAIGLIQLAKLKKAIERRREIAAAYNATFKDAPGVITPWARTPSDINYQLYTIRVNPDFSVVSRDKLIIELEKRGIAARLYYPCLHTQGVFSHWKVEGKYPNSLRYAETALSLPIYPDLTKEEIKYVSDTVLALVKGSL
jgi:dTDP-4-amino-4,6-dideoxygalactose transaminase